MTDGRIVVSGLTKQYKSLTAVDDLSFTVEPGRVTGFLGPNGAGKTTTLRMLLDLVTPTAGSATIGGRRYSDIDEPIRAVGAVLEASSAHKGRTGRNHLRACCLTTGLPLSRAEEVLELTGLMPAADRNFKGYSLGMRQRLGIAAAMLGDPDVLILDEPANGLDPEGIRWMRELLQGLATRGRTVLVSSHLLSEMQELADDVVIVAAGRLVRQGSVADIISSIPNSGQVQAVTPEPEKLAAALINSGATVLTGAGGILDISGATAATVGNTALAIGVPVHQLRTEEPDLEDVFLELTQGKADIRLTRLVRAEIFKLRTTNLWWLFGLAILISTTVQLVINLFTANSLLKPLAQYVSLSSHGHGNDIPPDFLAHLTSEWTLGHNAVTQAATIYTSGQLIGVLLACLLGIVIITSEFYQQTATTTFLLTPRRTDVIISKLITGVLMAALAWLVSTVITVVAGAVFLHAQGYGTQLGQWGVVRAVLLNLAAYLIWAVFGVGFGALVRSQLGATVSATVLYLVGAAAAASVFELINTYVIQKTWVLTAEVVVPAVASAVMISPTKTYTESAPQWVGAAVLIGYGLVAGALGIATLRRRDIA